MSKAAPVVEELDELEELEELDEDDSTDLADELEETPADAVKPKRKPPVRPHIEYSSAWLATYLNDQCGTSYDARALRVLLRKLSGEGVIARVVGQDRSRYDFSGGPEGATVSAIVKAVKKAQSEPKPVKVKKEKAVQEAPVIEDAIEDDESDELEDVAPVKKATPVRRRRPAAAK